MAVGRVLSSGAAVVAVAGCAALAIGMSRAATGAGDAAKLDALPTLTAQSDPPVVARTQARTSVAPPRSAVAVRSPHRAAQPAPVRTRVAVKVTHAPARRVVPHIPPTSTPAPRPAPRPAPSSAPRPAPQRGQSLPVAGSTTGATRVITVVASSYRSTTATLQAWVAAPGGGWLRYGAAILAHVGADGVSTTPSEASSATPIGSFTLTQAFGTYSDPGTALPYLQTNPSDWWISQSGPLYNTHQRCASGCGFTLGEPNEHLAYILPYYRYSVVIDYNTRNAPGGVRQGAGSAFFLHVTDGRATAGCIGIPQSNLVSIMKWLMPSAHPRILIGLA